jgi:transcriptional regulator ATRX
MILTLAPIALALSMAGQPSLDLTAEAAALPLSPQEAPAQEGDATQQDKKKGAKQKGGDAKKRGAGKRAEEMKALRKRFDKDGDGKLNDAEGKALREHMQAERKKNAAEKKKGAEKGGKKGDRRTGGAGGQTPEQREALKKQFDADGDGKLNETERAALRKHVATQRKEGKGGETGGEAGKKKRKRTVKKKEVAKKKTVEEKKNDDGV